MNLIILTADDFISPTKVRLKGRRHVHIAGILQAELGQNLRVGFLNGLIGQGQIVCTSAEQTELEVVLDQQPPAPLPLGLILALPRPKALKRILHHVTSMGIKQVDLINSWRVEKSYWQSPVLNQTALREALLLGLEQGRDTLLPTVRLHPRFKPFIEDELPRLTVNAQPLLADAGAPHHCPADAERSILLALGPEGGFIPYEMHRFIEFGFRSVRLGARTLRVETAVPALIGRLMRN